MAYTKKMIPALATALVEAQEAGDGDRVREIYLALRQELHTFGLGVSITEDDCAPLIWSNAQPYAPAMERMGVRL